MLAELAAANAAFAVIKAAVNNGGEIMQAGQKLLDYFDAKATIQKKYNEKAKSGSASSDMEEFMALEQLKAQEEHLKQSMIYAGRPGMWEDWLKFQAESARKRAAAERAEKLRRARRRAAIINALWYGVLAILVAALIFVTGWIWWLMGSRK